MNIMKFMLWMLLNTKESNQSSKVIHRINILRKIRFRWLNIIVKKNVFQEPVRKCSFFLSLHSDIAAFPISARNKTCYSNYPGTLILLFQFDVVSDVQAKDMLVICALKTDETQLFLMFAYTLKSYKIYFF